MAAHPVNNLKAPVRPLEKENCGIIYLVTGGRSYLGELITSLKSLRRHEPSLPVTVFSKFSLPAALRAEVVKLNSEEHPLKLKVLVLKQSPYKRTLFLDTDTLVRGRLLPIFDLLDQFDFAIAENMLADWSCRPPRLLGLVAKNDYNTGVFLYKRTLETDAFLGLWEKAVLAQDPSDMWAGHNCDQTYFNRIVQAGAPQECGLRFGVFPNTVYNVRGPMVSEMKRLGIWEQTRVLHHRTSGMKIRKLFYSVSDPKTAREIALKAIQRGVRRSPSMI